MRRKRNVRKLLIPRYFLGLCPRVARDAPPRPWVRCCGGGEQVNTKRQRRYVGQREFARELDVAPSYVAKLVQQGKIPTIGGRIDREAALKALEAEAAAKAGSGESYYSARAKLVQVQSHLKLLELQQRRGELVRAEEMREAATRVFARCRDRLLRIHLEVRQRYPAHPEVAAAVDERVRAALEELSRGLLPMPGADGA